MYKDKKIGVVIPAYNEELLIAETISGVPAYIDTLFVIDDASTDQTKKIVEQLRERDKRIVLITHSRNEGLGKSLVDGYLKSLESDIDITGVMAGDNQMDPRNLPALLNKVIEDGYDYIKGNRLLHHRIVSMPRYRFFGNAILTILTKFATGYYFIMDPQCGYTVIKNSVLAQIPIREMTRGYGYNADILCMLNINGFCIADVIVHPVYDREMSKIKLWKYIPKTSWLLARLFFRRLWKRYVVLDFHPLVLFYLFAFFNVIFILIPLTIRFFVIYSMYGELPKTTLTILFSTFFVTFQSILFAIWMDMDYNRKK